MVATNSLTTRTDAEVEHRRDQLALDVRSDPSLRKELAEVEEELASRRANRERDEAAAREQVRREEQDAIRRAERERKRRVKAEREAGVRLAEIAADVEQRLDELADKLVQAVEAIDARSRARVALGSPADNYPAGQALVHRTIYMLGRVRPFVAETNSIDRELGARGSLSALLGVRDVTGGER